MKSKRGKIKKKKIIVKKILRKKSSVLKKRKLFVLKKKVALSASRTKKETEVFAKLQDLRDVVERLPDMPLPGAPIDIPKDLPNLNPVIEPALLPETVLEFKSSVSEVARMNPEKEKINLRQKNSSHARETGKGIGMLVAVAATFSVILGVWATMLGGATSSSVSEISFDEDLEGLKEEWKNTTENIKAVLADMNTRLDTPAVQEERKPGDDVLKAVGARVIFEASRSASGTVTFAP